MLVKLLRHEAKTQGRTVTSMFGILAAAMVFMILLFLLSRISGNRIAGTTYRIACALYALTVIVVVITNFIYLCFHFYRSMYSEQGYLTHTLPVKTTQILNVKILVSLGYLFLTGVLAVVSFVMIGLTADGISVGTLVQLAGQVVKQTAHELGTAPAVLVCFVLLLFLLGWLNALLTFFAGSSIGQLSHRSKAACGIAASIGLYYCSQIISVVLLLLGYPLYTTVLSSTMVPIWAMAGTILLLGGWAAIYYIICRVIVQKHLNLE